MFATNDPVALLPLAVAGLVIGAGLALGSGYGLHLQWSGRAWVPNSPRHTTIEGRTQWVGWRASAAPEGPDWYLEVRLADHPRGFLVAASGLADPSRFGSPEAGRGIPALMGQPATVVVDSSFLSGTGRHPYLSALRVDGEAIVPLADGASNGTPRWLRWVVGLLLGGGVVIGVGVVGVCLQHVLLCVRRRDGLL